MGSRRDDPRWFDFDELDDSEWLPEDPADVPPSLASVVPERPPEPGTRAVSDGLEDDPHAARFFEEWGAEADDEMDWGDDADPLVDPDDPDGGGWGPPAYPTGGGKGGSGGRRRPGRARHRLLVALVVVLSVLLAAGLAASALVLYGSSSVEKVAVEGISTRKGRTVTLPDGESIQVMNVLLIGVDDPSKLTAEQIATVAPDAEARTGGRRPDTMMLAQLQVGGTAAAIVSLPRDLRVELCDGTVNKLNAALVIGDRAGIGGESCLVQTVTSLTGIEIDHYVEVGFAGFLNVVEALGGVTMYFDEPIVDRKAHVNIPAGCVTLSPEQALGFVRTRGYDDDFGRMARQQRFIKETIEEATRIGVLANPSRLAKLVDRAANAVRTDEGLGIREMRDLALGLRNMSSAGVIAHTLPGDHANIDGIAYVALDEAEAEPLFAAFRDGSVLQPAEVRAAEAATPEPTLEPGDLPPITVLNSTDTSGLASEAAEALRALGFRVADTGNAEERGLPVTQVRHGTGLDEQAEVLAAALPAAEVLHAPGGPPLEVVLGTDITVAALDGMHPADAPEVAEEAPETGEPDDPGADADGLADADEEVGTAPDPSPSPTPAFRGAQRPADVDC